MPYLKQLRELSKQLTETEHYLSMLFNLSQDLLVITNIDGVFKKVSPSCEVMLGWSVSEMESRPWIYFVHPDDMKKTLDQFNKMKNGGTVYDFVNRYRCKDGGYKRLSWRASRIVDEKFGYAIARDLPDVDLSCNKLDCKEREHNVR